MENPPERRDGASHLRASDADRERVAEMLGQAMATGQLSHDEYSERLDTLYQVKTVGELDVLTHDLQVAPRPRPAPAEASYSYDPAPGGQSEKLVAVFSGSQRTGRWRVRRRIDAIAVFGGVELDMSDAIFESPQVEVRVTAVFGGVDIKVPEGVEVRCEGTGIFGGFDVRGSAEPDPNAPVVIVRGLAVFGGAGGRPRKRKKR
ncbi:hypothetical protein HNP84_001643 [Thermocatellispora tengchongensis]|uniref:Cell wall-active antibiotics response LiaF-like C-terminal domain-containing protein n=1 Tax=Thermocatellispora tengchongensis TaxID=1073253 RepID=A0A840P376_9ACTN|nr:DUF1707 domain-containing protein [Thermocatellispora tengchongensis]MBB5131930.1 hypothetical protein [Thermocatellispora tengchongensis]